jgi:hypothetical protein
MQHYNMYASFKAASTPCILLRFYDVMPWMLTDIHNLTRLQRHLRVIRLLPGRGTLCLRSTSEGPSNIGSPKLEPFYY